MYPEFFFIDCLMLVGRDLSGKNGFIALKMSQQLFSAWLCRSMIKFSMRMKRRWVDVCVVTPSTCWKIFSSSSTFFDSCKFSQFLAAQKFVYKCLKIIKPPMIFTDNIDKKIFMIFSRNMTIYVNAFNLKV